MPTVGGAIGDPLYHPVHGVDPEGASHEIDTIYTLSILIFIKTVAFKDNLFSHMEESMRGNLSPDPQRINVIFSPVCTSRRRIPDDYQRPHDLRALCCLQNIFRSFLPLIISGVGNGTIIPTSQMLKLRLRKG